MTWTPKESGAYIWLDPNDTSTTTIIANELAQIDSKIGTAQFMTIGSRPSEPVMRGDALMSDGTANSNRLIAFDNYAKAITQLSTAKCFMAILEVAAPSSYYGTHEVVTAGGRAEAFVSTTGDDALYQIFDNQGNGLGGTNTAGGLLTAGLHILVAIVDPTLGTRQIRLDGVLRTSHLPPAPLDLDNTEALGIGYLNLYGGGNPWMGYLGDMTLYKDSVTIEEAEKFEGYVAHKYGAAALALLPADHPYKTSPPPSSTPTSSTLSKHLSYPLNQRYVQ